MRIAVAVQDSVALRDFHFALHDRKSAAQRVLAAWTRENLLALGPTFIKLGQLFSTRSDLLPAEFTEVRSRTFWLVQSV